MAEKDLWDRLRRLVGWTGHWVRVESYITPGYPDVSWAVDGVEGLLELKQVPRWPADPVTPLAVPHYTDVQRDWHLARARAGGRVHLLLEVCRPRPEYLLFTGAVAARGLGRVARLLLYEQALDVWCPKLDGRALIRQLRA